MGCYKIGSECCNNCVHWNCHSERKFQGNPPKDVYTTSNCDKCNLTGRTTLSKDTCGMFKHIGGITRTFAAEQKHADNDYAGRMLDGCDEGARSMLQSTLDYLREQERVDAAMAEFRRPKKVRSTCSRCGGSGRVSCNSCGGSGRTECSHCDGEGGFLIKLEVREDYERFTKNSYWLPDDDLDLKFYGIGDGNWGSDTIETFDGQRVICKKDVEVAYGDEPRRHAKDALQMDDSSFDFPESMSESFRAKILDKFESLCKSVDDEAENWDGGSWSSNIRIKEASVSVKQTPCMVRVAFKDAHGFPYRALVNLANNKVHLYAVDEGDAAKVMTELEAKANAGDVDLQNDIGMMYAHYLKFNHVVSENREKAVSWFLGAACAGCADAMDNLGNCYNDGYGVVKDKELAVAWYQRAAKKGLACGQFHYARCLLNGSGVEKDTDLALHWYFKAARQGMADAQNMVGRCAEEGWGMKEDPEIAFYWIEMAANGGDATAMNNLACFYKKGYGCEKDSDKEEQWRKKAEENGYVRKESGGW